MHWRCCRPVAGIINKPLLLHLVGCLYYLYQWCTVKQISNNETYLLIKYIKSVLWRVAKRLSYKQDARCLKFNVILWGPGNSVGIATGYGLDGPLGARFSAPFQTGPGAHPASCIMGTGFFPGVKSDRGVTLTSHSLLVPWSRKGRAIPLLSLWAGRPVQSLSACTRVHITFTLLGNIVEKLRKITIRCVQLVPWSVF